VGGAPGSGGGGQKERKGSLSGEGRRGGGGGGGDGDRDGDGEGIAAGADGEQLLRIMVGVDMGPTHALGAGDGSPKPSLEVLAAVEAAMSGGGAAGRRGRKGAAAATPLHHRKGDLTELGVVTGSGTAESGELGLESQRRSSDDVGDDDDGDAKVMAAFRASLLGALTAHPRDRAVLAAPDAGGGVPRDRSEQDEGEAASGFVHTTAQHYQERVVAERSLDSCRYPPSRANAIRKLRVINQTNLRTGLRRSSLVGNDLVPVRNLFVGGKGFDGSGLPLQGSEDGIGLVHSFAQERLARRGGRVLPGMLSANALP
jgi:hypothetical protein